MNKSDLKDFDLNKIDINMSGHKESLLVRTGAFLKHPNYELTVPHKGRMFVKRLLQHMYILAKVNKGNFTLTTPFENAHIICHKIRKGETLILNMNFVLAFSESLFPKEKWSI